jgi:hypothetical protein
MNIKNYESIGVQMPEILLPKKDADFNKWSVVACDQYTSQPEYWQEVYKNVGNTPSTAHVIFPEVYLEEPGKEERIKSIQGEMKEYLEKGVFDSHFGFVYVKRNIKGKMRRGLVVALDLEKYDYNPGSQTLIRATEGTVLKRLPPRMEIREGALLESPHIMVLIDDPEKTIIEGLIEYEDRMDKIYDFDLMMNGGHIAGYLVPESKCDEIAGKLAGLANKQLFQSKYRVGEDKGVLLFAMGDGNHSLATAKAIWEKNKAKVGMDHSSRWALVELVNVHDKALEFEPIHRVLFNVKKDFWVAIKDYFKDDFIYSVCDSKERMMELVNEGKDEQKFGMIFPNGFGIGKFRKSRFNLTVGTLQEFLDKFLESGGAEKIDYVHGLDVVCDLAKNEGNFGLYLPGMSKHDLFKTVIVDGVLPRKTFSMGEAEDKRFYLECRKIV